MKFYGIEMIDEFKPSTSDYFVMMERNFLQMMMTALYLNGRPTPSQPGYLWNGLLGGFLAETHMNATGRFGFVDGSSSAVWEPAAQERFYDTGDSITTKTLYNWTYPIERLVVDEITNFPTVAGTKVEVSFDDGATWTSTQTLGYIHSFSGTTTSGGYYKLKLRFSRSSGEYNWTVTTAMNRPRGNTTGCGTYIDTLCMGGEFYTDYAYSNAFSDTTEKWNGSTWASTSTINVARGILGSCGTTADALCFGGGSYASSTNDDTEKWNGSTWATTANMVQGRYSLTGCGTTAAALNFGGSTLGAGPYQDTTEKWAGSSWATTSSMTEARDSLSGCGTTAAALNFGGSSGSSVSTTEIWNGSTWATTTSLPDARLQVSGVGTTASAMSFGGSYKTAIWNGSIWSTSSQPTCVFTRWWPGGSGIAGNALSFGGASQGYVGLTEKYTLGSQLAFGVKIN